MERNIYNCHGILPKHMSKEWAYNEEYKNIYLVNKVMLNLPKLFNKVIYEMIDAFMSTNLLLTLHIPEISWIEMTMCTPPILCVKNLKSLHKTKTPSCMIISLFIMILVHSCIVV